MAVEDFTTYTKVDDNSHITLVGTNEVDHSAFDNEDAYIYKDYGVDHFGDFTHKIQVKGTYVDSGGHGFPWLLSEDTLDDAKGLQVGSKTSILVMFYAYSSSQMRITVGESYAGSGYWADSYYGVFDTSYYLLIKKTETSFLCGIYSTEALRDAGDATDGDLGNLSLTLQADHKFRYVMVANTWNDGSSEELDTVAIDLDLQEAVGASYGYIIG